MPAPPDHTAKWPPVKTISFANSIVIWKLLFCQFHQGLKGLKTANIQGDSGRTAVFWQEHDQVRSDKDYCKELCVYAGLVRSRRTQWPWPEWPPRSGSGLLLLLLEDGEDPGFTDLFGEPLSGKVDCRSAAVFEI